MEPHMSYIRDLIRQVREERGLKLKQVALVSGYSVSAISQYEVGHLTVPAVYLPGLFRATMDVRLLTFVAPGFQVVDARSTRPARIPPPGDPQELNDRLLEAIEELVKVARYNRRIFADGVINEADNVSIAQQQKHAARVQNIISSHLAAVMQWKQADEKAKQTG